MSSLDFSCDSDSLSSQSMLFYSHRMNIAILGLAHEQRQLGAVKGGLSRNQMWVWVSAQCWVPRWLQPLFLYLRNVHDDIQLSLPFSLQLDC